MAISRAIKFLYHNAIRAYCSCTCKLRSLARNHVDNWNPKNDHATKLGLHNILGRDRDGWRVPLCIVCNGKIGPLACKGIVSSKQTPKVLNGCHGSWMVIGHGVNCCDVNFDPWKFLIYTLNFAQGSRKVRARFAQAYALILKGFLATYCPQKPVAPLIRRLTIWADISSYYALSERDNKQNHCRDWEPCRCTELYSGSRPYTHWRQIGQGLTLSGNWR